MVINMILREILVCFLLMQSTYAIVSKGFTHCRELFFLGIPPEMSNDNGFGMCEASNKCLCENYQGTYYLASYYDTVRKVPLFSAYTVSQFQKANERMSKGRNWRKGFGLERDEQPLPGHYIGVGRRNLNRGHLAPRFYYPTNTGRKASDVLTNIALQYTRFNQYTWVTLEKSIFHASRDHCNNYGGKSYFITGVIPNDNAFFPPNWPRWKINIPSHFWTAVCCDTSNVSNFYNRFKGWSFAYIIANVNTKINSVNMFTVSEFQKVLSIRSQYDYVRLFESIHVYGWPRQVRYVSNCLFDSYEAHKVINEIETSFRLRNPSNFFKPLYFIDSRYESPNRMFSMTPYLGLMNKYRRFF